MSELVERVARAYAKCAYGIETNWQQFDDEAREIILAMRELPAEPGPRYAAGEYSRRNHAAMIDDALCVGITTSQE